ncbi:MAG: hypothetical protein LBN37_03535 [Bacteroidales bacterium]|jgi:hypothetical protein|nr:hypothetical protein [Bacteroidales bacterium]
MDNTQYQDDRLTQLFRQLPEKQPSGDFTAQVMQRVMLERQYAGKRQRTLRMAGYVAAGCCAVAVSAAGAYYYLARWFRFLDISISLSPVKEGFANIASLFATANHRIFAIGLAAILLLGADLLIQYALMRREK